MRYAIRVLGKYENDDWLGPDGNRTSQSSGEWPVSYFGTDISSAEKIVKEGYKVGPRAKFGKGIYTSPSLEMIERLYAQEFPYDGGIKLLNRIGLILTLMVTLKSSVLHKLKLAVSKRR